MNKIGIFDSGIGGLSVLANLIQQLPNYHYLYLADQANCPYGTKSKEQLLKILTKIITYFKQQAVNLIIIACNTASTLIDHLQPLTDIKIIGIIDSTAIAALNHTTNHQIALLATSNTIKEQTYQHLLKQSLVVSISADSLVKLVETKLDQDLTTLIEPIIQPLKNSTIDTIIYGCTHFNFLDHYFKKLLPTLTYILSGFNLDYQAINNLMDNQTSNYLTTLTNPTITLITSGDLNKFYYQVTHHHLISYPFLNFDKIKW